MTTIQEIKSAISSLSHQEYMQLLGWIHDKDWSEWDKQLEADAASGKLDFLAKEALEAKKKNKLREL
jgi:predicted acyl esterase